VARRNRRAWWARFTFNGITRYDCNADLLLLSVEQVGEVACHTGARSCFYDQGPSPSAGGPGADPPSRRRLHGADAGDRGPARPARARQYHQDPGEIAGEAADLVFHLQVALPHHGVEWRQVQAVLAARRGAPRRE
jgi:phosphoribosyl-ATP pyrophosphohydrolase/phosphoribosyl-AMP cyclohydrolase